MSTILKLCVFDEPWVECKVEESGGIENMLECQWVDLLSICFEREKIIDTLFRENVKEEYAFWDYFSIQDSEVIILYHYWTHTEDNKHIPKYNRSSMKIHMEK